jgi:hypothetical protein
VTPNPALVALLESGEFDWDNDKHREAYLRAWVKGNAPPPPEPAPEKEGHA